jgi:hypothetical protein
MDCKLTIAGMFHHSECASSCTSYNPFGTWYDCALKGLHLVQPFLREIDEVFSESGKVTVRRGRCCKGPGAGVVAGSGLLDAIPDEQESWRGAVYMRAVDLASG